MNIAIIRTGTANLASVIAAFRRLSATPRVVTRPNELQPQDAVVLPGVGAFAAGMEALSTHGWDRVLIQRFADSKPTLAICLGLQLLCRTSAENPGVCGLGILPADVRRLPDNVVVPHFGWNRVESTSEFLEGGFAYYANSYCAVARHALPNAGWEVAVTNHGIPFVAAVRRGALLACQFHPELSGAFGARLLSRWLAAAAEKVAGTELIATKMERTAC